MTIKNIILSGLLALGLACIIVVPFYIGTRTSGIADERYAVGVIQILTKKVYVYPGTYVATILCSLLVPLALVVYAGGIFFGIEIAIKGSLWLSLLLGFTSLCLGTIVPLVNVVAYNWGRDYIPLGTIAFIVTTIPAILLLRELKKNSSQQAD